MIAAARAGSGRRNRLAEFDTQPSQSDAAAANRDETTDDGSGAALKDRITDSIASACVRHPKRILLLATLAAVLSISAVTQIQLDPDILNLVPQNNKAVQEFKRVIEEMGTIDYHVVVIDIPEGREAGDYSDYIDATGLAWSRSTLSENVTYKVPNPVELIDTILPRAMLFLSPEQVDEVASALSDENIRASVARNRALLETPQAIAMKDVVRYDPFNLLPVFLERFEGATGDSSLDLSSGYYLAKNHRIALVLVKPRHSAQDLPFAREIIEQSKEVEKSVAAGFAKQHPDLPLPKLSYTGGYMIAYDDSELIKSDMIANVIVSVAGVLLIFLWGFRRLASIGYAAIPLGLALLVTYGVAALAFDKLASAAAGFAALLAGLGIDFIMMVYGRYVDERNTGVEMEPALRTAMRTTFPAISIAAVTTAATFYAFLATDFQGMSQLGFLTGTGVLIFLVSVMFVLPALLVINEGPTRKRRPPRHFHHDFGAKQLVSFSINHPRVVVSIWGALVLGMAFFASRVEFSDRIQDLRSKENRGIQVQDRLTREMGQAFDFMMFTVEDPTLDGILDKTADATKKLDRLVRSGELASYQAITTFIPPASQQRATIERLAAGREGAFDPVRIERTFRAALVENGFRPDSYDTYLPIFAQSLSPRETLALDQIENRDVRKLIGRYVKKTANGYMSVIYLYAPGGYWGRSIPPALADMGEAGDGAILTGVNVMSGALRSITRNDALRATTLSFAIVFLLMLISFKGSPRLTLLAFIPFGAGIVVMLGAMAILGLKFNFMNIFIGLMLIGVATDYAIYMLQRYMESPDTFALDAADTAKAVVMAAATTFWGYGTYALSHYPGLRSIGYASAFGVGISAIAAITLLPAILTIKPHPVKGDARHTAVPGANTVESDPQI